MAGLYNRSMSLLLQARVVFPVDRPPIEHGVVTIEGERIVAVGAKAEHGEAIDLGDVALLPGLVNAHTHLEFSQLLRPLGTPGMSLPEWIRLVIAERARGSSDAGVSHLLGLTESWSCGVTTIGDILQGYAAGCASAAAEASVSTLFLEVIGFSRARAESSFDAASNRLMELSKRCRAQIGISPHAPYTVSPDLLKRLVGLAIDRELPVAMHLAESAEELELLASGAGPFQELLVERSMWDAEAIPKESRPLDYLRMLADAPRTLVIHGNYLDDEELAFLAANRERMSVVYCPRTHAYFGHTPYPLAKALSSGVRIVLGTDSRASNPDLDLLAEMRYVARSHSLIDPHDVLRMGTLAGAEALGRDDETGSITPGKLANLVAIPCGDGAGGQPSDMLAALLANNKTVSAVWLRGRGARYDAGAHLDREP
jgi:cytosine/adenosine deaminase-related metal-dependent hydrolase